MKILSGTELSGFIKERQAQQVRSLAGSSGAHPKLAIIVTVDNPVIDIYVRLKKQYGHDLGIDVDVYRIKQSEVPVKLLELNKDDQVNGIIIQLPLEDSTQTNTLTNLVDPNKDVDALGSKSKFEPATPMAIMWLLAGYNVDLRGKSVLLIGKGKLVGQPLERLLKSSDIDVKVADRSTSELADETLEADVIITATGSPAILYPNMVKEGAVVVDAGVASEDGKTVGDVDDSLYERDDLTITPKKGGVGPLTVCALFENVILAASKTLKA
jgi:methylenetetrahydrofolate dehydrogenase (NADP+)/methenyltetrahydrofolate cyclohydrolase